MKKFIFAAALAAITLVACDRSEQVANDLREVKFRVENIGTYTMKSVAITADDGLSQVGIFAADLGATNVAATIESTTLTPASPIYWAAGQADDATKDFVAYYPYAEGRTMTSAEFIPPYNQNGGNVDYSAFDNFVTATKTAAPNTEGGVKFAFTHPFAKMIIAVSNTLGSDVVNYVKVSGIKLATAIDISTSPVTFELAAEPAASGIYAKPTEDNVLYEFVLAPQSAQPTIEIGTIKGSKYVFTTAAAYNFTAGGAAKAEVTLSNGSSTGGSSLSPVSGVSVDLTDAAWPATPATATFTADADNTSVSEAYWYMVSDADGWATDYPMTYHGTTDDGSEEWMITFDYTAGTEFKFRQNKDWTNNFGGGALTVENNIGAVAGGANLTLPETGNYTVYLKLKTDANKFWVVKNVEP